MCGKGEHSLARAHEIDLNQITFGVKKFPLFLKIEPLAFARGLVRWAKKLNNRYDLSSTAPPDFNITFGDRFVGEEEYRWLSDRPAIRFSEKGSVGRSGGIMGHMHVRNDPARLLR